MKRLALLLLLTVALSSICMYGQGGPTGKDGLLPATNIDINAARADVLQSQLAQAETLIIGLRADIAVCQANTEQAKREYQSLVLTSDVAKQIEKLKAQFGGDWVWDNVARRIVPVKAKPTPATPVTDDIK